MKRFLNYTFLLMLITSNAAMAQSLSSVTPEFQQADALAAAREANQLVLQSAIYDPRFERVAYELVGVPDVADRGYGLVQFNENSAAARLALESPELQFLGYLPHNSYVVRWTARGRQALANHPDVRFSGAYQAGMKLDPRLWPANLPAVGVFDIDIIGHPGEDMRRLQLALAKFTGQSNPVYSFSRGNVPTLRYRLEAFELADFVVNATRVEGIAWIEEFLLPELLNDDSVGPIQSNDDTTNAGATPFWDNDLIGSDQIVTVADSGLDRNQCWFTQFNDGGGTSTGITDADSPVPPMAGNTEPGNKVFAYWVQPGASEYDDNNVCTTTPTGFHGTHTVGTVAGDRGAVATPTDPAFSASDQDGMAPNAQILFQDVGNDATGCLTGLGGDRVPMYQQSHDADGFIHSNSYGAGTNGAYTGSDADTDRALWQFEDMMIVISAGNSGPGGGTTGSPGNAKNSVTVGATQHGNNPTVVGFSSRGPTADGRIKPDITAPGQSILSARGDDNDATTACPTASSKSGTSMSAPTVAGGTALARQYFTDGFYPTGARTAADAYKPSGRLLKAVLLNGTLTDTTTPGTASGWGRMWMDNNMHFSGDTRRFRHWDLDNETGIETGQTHSYTINVPTGAQEFRATLVWYDPPATVSAGTTLINNLDLEVDVPGQGTFLGNNFTNGASTPGGNADILNPVEAVRLVSAPTGTYTIRVDGTNVPGTGNVFYSDRQGYSLVVSWAGNGSGVSQAPTLNSVTDNGLSGIDVSATSATGATGYQFYRADGSCAVSSADFRYIATNATPSYTDDTTVGGREYAYRVRGIDANGEGALSNCMSVVSNDVCPLFPDFDQTAVSAQNNAGTALCDIQLDWNAGSSNCPLGPGVTYNLYRSNSHNFTPAPGNLVASGINGTTTNDGNLAALTTYFYVVRAEDSTTQSGGPGNGGNEAPGNLIFKATAFGNTQSPGTFVDGADGASFATLDSPWVITDQRASAGTLSYRNSQDGEDYPNQVCGAVTLPPIDLPAGGNPQLSYDAFWDIEADWDGVVVEISTDGGNNWTDLPPAGGYPGDFNMTGDPPINECGYVASQGAFNGNSGGVFQGQSSSLSAFAGQTVQIRWRFSSDPGSTGEGFYLDDVQITDASTYDACTFAEEIFIDGLEDVM